MLEPLGEANCALRILQKSLIRGTEEQLTLHAQLSLIGVFDPDFVQFVKDNPADPTEKLKEGLDYVMRAKTHFSSP